MGQSKPSLFAPVLEGLEQRLLLAANADWTFLVYLDGDNTLGAATWNDVNLMESIGSTAPSTNPANPQPNVPGGVNIVVQVDDQANGTWRSLITKDDLPGTITSTLTNIGEQNSADPAVLTAFLQWGMDTYPADHYALVIMDDGGGIDGTLRDATSNMSMSIKDMASAIFNAENPSGQPAQPIDLVAFDASSINSLEVAYQLKGVSPVVVASQGNVPAAGLPYDWILDDLATTPSMTAAELGQSFVDRYGQYWDANNFGVNLTMSSVDTSQLAPMASAIDDLATAYLTQDTDWSVIADALNPAIGNVTTISGSSGPDYADLRGLLAYISANAADPTIAGAANAALTTFDNMVLDNYSSLQFDAAGNPVLDATSNQVQLDANGVSIYLPQLPADTVLDPVYTTDNFTFLQDTRWLSALDAYEFARPQLVVSNGVSQVVNGAPNVFGFGSILASSPMPTQTFTVQNTGDADLTLTAPDLPDGFVLVGFPDAGPDGLVHIPAGLSLDIQIGMITDVPGHYDGTVTINNNDLNDGTFVRDGNDLSIGPGAFTFTVSGDVTSSGQIAVSSPDGVLSSGDSVDFGQFNPGDTTPPVTFTVTNSDINDLSIGNITVTGDYTLVKPAPAPLGFNGQMTFTLQLNTTQVGIHSGQVVIPNSDPNTPQFTFDVTGRVSGPDLTVVGATYTPGNYASGDGLDLKLTIHNDGDRAIAAGTSTLVEVQLDNVNNVDYLSVFSRNISLPAIAPGESVILSQSLNLTLGNVNPGDYYVGTRINGDGAVPELDSTNNIWWSANPDIAVYNSRYYTRLINGQHVSFRDDTKDLVTIIFTGAGHVDILTSNSLTGHFMGGDVRQLMLGDTAANSVLRVTARGAGMTVHEIASRNEMKSIITRGVDLAPDPAIDPTYVLTVNGGCGQITLRNLASGSTINVGTSPDIANMAVTLGRLADSIITSLTPLKSFSAVEWLNQYNGTDNLSDALNAPWVDKLTTTGDKNKKTPSAGNFQADLNLTQAPAQQALGTAKIAGGLSDALWTIGGGIKELTVAGVAGNSTIRTTGSIGKITVGQADTFDVLAGAKATVVRHALATPADFDNMSASIGSYTIKGKTPALMLDTYFQDSNISAPSIGTVSLLNVLWNNALTPFGIWAGQITKVQYASKPHGIKWTYPFDSGVIVELQDMKIQII